MTQWNGNIEWNINYINLFKFILFCLNFYKNIILYREEHTNTNEVVLLFSISLWFFLRYELNFCLHINRKFLGPVSLVIHKYILMLHSSCQILAIANHILQYRLLKKLDKNYSPFIWSCYLAYTLQLLAIMEPLIYWFLLDS
jgi:hypothetical protein